MSVLRAETAMNLVDALCPQELARFMALIAKRSIPAAPKGLRKQQNDRELDELRIKVREVLSRRRVKLTLQNTTGKHLPTPLPGNDDEIRSRRSGQTRMKHKSNFQS